MRRPNINSLDFPWRPDDACPCESGLNFAKCCLAADGAPLVRCPSLIPPGVTTGIANDGCYMRRTENCSEKLSREHYVSENILRQFENAHVEVGGLPWIPEGETRQYAPNALASKVLCERHNNALSPLDTLAGKAFKNITEAFVHCARKSLSTRPAFFLISGDGFEKWGIKTLLGLYHARISASKRKVLADSYTLNDVEAVRVLSGGDIAFPLGMHAYPTTSTVSSIMKFQFAPLSSDELSLTSGLRLAIWGVHFDVLVDRKGINSAFLAAPGFYRPWVVDLVGPKRTARLLLTWQRNRSQATRVEILIKEK